MAYNTGLYVSVAKMLKEMVNAGQANSKNLVLSGRVLTTGTEFEYDFTPATPAPAVGDYIVQGDYHSIISSVVGAKLRVAVGTNIANGKAKAIDWENGDEQDIVDFITQAMSFIERHTRQWFNARTFDDTKPILIEGNNSETLFLPVPILEITAIKKQADSEILDPSSYQVFKGCSFPDDRRNPMIKLRRDSDDIMYVSSGKWMRGVRAVITGIFGYLEEDGSTPKMIQRATLKLAMIYASKSIGAAAASQAESAEVGPIKREKTDLHETEYFDPRAGGSAGNDGTGLSGDDEIDDIIASFKGPIIIGGTFPDIGIEAPVLASWNSKGSQ